MSVHWDYTIAIHWVLLTIVETLKVHSAVIVGNVRKGNFSTKQRVIAAELRARHSWLYVWSFTPRNAMYRCIVEIKVHPYPQNLCVAILFRQNNDCYP